MTTALKMKKIRQLFIKVAGTEAKKWKRREDNKVNFVNVKGDIFLQHGYVFEGDDEAGNDLFWDSPSEIIMRTDFEGYCYEIWFGGREWLRFKQLESNFVINGSEVVDNEIFQSIMLRFFKDIADEKTLKEAEEILA